MLLTRSQSPVSSLESSMSNFSVACGAHIITLWVFSDIGAEAVPRALLRIRCVYVLGMTHSSVYSVSTEPVLVSGE